MRKLLFIVGPTASGKTKFSIECAKLLNTEIISSDSMQIYKGLNVGTAKVTKDEMDGVKHHLIDFVDPKSSFSVAEYRENAIKIIDNLFENNKTPIICGGTGLYVNGVLYPLNFSDTNKNEELREKLKEEYLEYGPKYMHDKLEKLDPMSASKIHENDEKRIIRALEINLTSGQRVENEVQKPEFDYLMIGFQGKTREELYDRINLRVEIMFQNGLIDEVKNVIDSGVDFSCQSMQAIGYKEFKDYFDGKISEYDLKELIKKHTRNYAKRQLTWFRQYKDIHWFAEPSGEALQLVKDTFLR